MMNTLPTSCCSSLEELARSCTRYLTFCLVRVHMMQTHEAGTSVSESTVRIAQKVEKKLSKLRQHKDFNAQQAETSATHSPTSASLLNGDSETPAAPAGANPSPRNKLERGNSMLHLVSDNSLRQLHEQKPSPTHSTITTGDAGVRGVTPVTDRPELEKRVDELGSNLAAFDEKIGRKMEGLESSLAKQGEMIKELMTTLARQHQDVNTATGSVAP